MLSHRAVRAAEHSFVYRPMSVVAPSECPYPNENGLSHSLVVRHLFTFSALLLQTSCNEEQPWPIDPRNPIPAEFTAKSRPIDS